jgi:type II secretory pathway component PulF
MAKRKKYTNRRILDIYSGLVRLFESGLTPVEALRRLGLEESEEDPFFNLAAEALEKGDSLATAFEKGAPGSFPERDLAVLEAAYFTGSHAEILQRLMNDHRRRSAVTLQFIVRASCPAVFFHLLAAAGVVVTMIYGLSALGVAGLCLMILPTWITAISGWSLYRRYWSGLESRDDLSPSSLATKIIGDSELGTFFRLAYTLTGAGLPVEEALSKSADLIRTQSIRRRVTQALSNRKEGELLAACLKEIGLRDDTFITRLRIGEESGEIEEALKETGEELSELARTRVFRFLNRATILLGALAAVGTILALL